jgi:hypothetical protein
VDPVPDPLLLRKSGNAGNRTRTSGSVAKNSDHYTTEAVIENCLQTFIEQITAEHEVFTIRRLILLIMNQSSSGCEELVGDRIHLRNLWIMDSFHHLSIKFRAKVRKPPLEHIKLSRGMKSVSELYGQGLYLVVERSLM